jgi:predicted Zn-dependent peptidase
MNSVKHTSLPNGFQIVYKKTTIPISCTYISCDVGSVHETDGIRGISHFIEHMCFKKTSHKTDEISFEFDKMGAETNAYTEKRYTCFTGKCPPDSTGNCIHLFSDIMLNAVFKKADFDHEYNVVLEETRIRLDNPVIMNESEVEQLLYKGSSYEQDVDRFSYHDKRFSLKQFIEFYKKMYVPSRMILFIITPLSFEKVKQFVGNSWFSKTATCNAILPTIQYYLEDQTDVRYKVIQKASISTSIIHLGIRVCGFSNTDKYCLELLKIIVGDSFSSRIYSILREENGLIYHPSVRLNHYENYGDFTISLRTKCSNVPRVLRLLVGILKDLLRNGVTAEEIQMAKGAKKGRMVLETTNIENQVEYLLEEWMFCPITIAKYKKPRSFMHCYGKINKADMDEVIRRYLLKKNMSLAITGNHLPAMTTIQSIFR